MILTEEEAKTKWCPHVRDYTKGTATPACNRIGGKHPESGWSNCIGSACMAWNRFQTKPEEHTKGYCGLSGRPT